MNAREAAAALGVSERTIRRAIGDGRLQATKVRGVFDVSLDDAQAAVRRRSGPSIYQDALAEALRLLRTFDHEDDARELEERHGLVYVQPEPRVYHRGSGE